MEFRYLRLFDRSDVFGERLPSDLVDELEIPIPPDPAEQFLVDHSDKHDFHEVYGDLDLHAMEWFLEDIPTSRLLTCTTKSASYERYVQETSGYFAEGLSLWEKRNHRPKDTAHWREHRTWSRPPVLLEHPLIDNGSLHLVEGHTRVGALRGLHAYDPSMTLETHKCWVGRARAHPVPNQWRQVLKRRHLNFRDWLSVGSEEESPRGRARSLVLNLEGVLRYYESTNARDLEGLMEMARQGLAHPERRYGGYSHEEMHELIGVLPGLHAEYLEEVESWFEEDS